MSSFWDRLGEVAESNAVGRFSKAAFNTWTGAKKLTWDLATAPINDDEKFNGFLKTIETSAKSFGESATPLAGYALGGINEVLETKVGQEIIKPSLEWIDKKGSEYIRKPASAIALMDVDFKNSGVWDGLDPNSLGDIKTAYGRARQMAETVSFGQAAYGSLQTDFGDEQSRKLFERFDWNDDQAVQEYFDSGSQQFWSGALDGYIQVFGDPTIVAGKAVGAVKATSFVNNKLNNINRVKQTIEAVKLAEDGVDTTSKAAKFLEDIVASDSLTLTKRREFKNVPGPVVYELGLATDTKTAGLIYRAGVLKDPNALLELKAVRPDVGNPIARGNGDLDRFQQWSLQNSTQQPGMFDMPWEDEALMAEIKIEMESIKANDAAFSRMFAIEEAAMTPGVSAVYGPGAKSIQAWSQFTAEAKSLKFYDKKTGYADVSTFQPTRMHRLYKVVTWPTGERPAGFVNFNDPDSSREISATIDRAIKNNAMPAETGANFMRDYIAAATPEAKGKIAYNIERYGLVTLAKKRGIDPTKAEALYEKYWRSRDTAFQTLKKNNFVVDKDGSIIKVPFYESQTINSTTMMDFDLVNSILRDYSLRSSDNLAKKAAGYTLATGRNLAEVADVAQSLFKIGTLLRLGYTARNGLEAQLRIWSSVGAMASMRHLPQGTANLVYNTGLSGKRIVDNVVLGKNRSYESKVQEFNTAKNSLSETRNKIATLENELKLNPDNVDTIGGIDLLRKAEQEELSIYNALKNSLNKAETRTPKKRAGSKANGFKYTSKTLGSKYEELDEALGGEFGDLYRGLSSSENSTLNLIDQQAGLFSSRLVDTGYGTVKPDSPNYWTEWSRIANRVLRNSEVSRMLAQALVDGTDKATMITDVAKWLRNSEEGRNLRIRINIDAKDSEEYVTIAKQMLDEQLPDVELQGLLANRQDISAELLRTKFGDKDNLPLLSGHLLEDNLNQTSIKNMQSVVNGMFKFLGSMPEDAWARHPVFINIYNQSMRRRIEEFESINNRALTYQEQKLLMRESRNEALRGTKSILFTIDRKSNLAASSLLKFSSPFFSAFENSMKTWAKLAYERPETITRANMIFTAPNRAGIATDEFGREVPPEEATMNDYIWLEIPEGMTKIPFIGKGLASLNQMGIQKKSLDVVFQGNIGLPVGPYAAVPLSKMVVNKPSLMDSFNWALPYGPERNAATAMLPSWFKKQLIKNQGVDSTQYANIYSLIWTTEQHKRRDAGQDPATEKEIKEMTDAYWNMRTVANLVLPFAPTFQTPYKFYVDQFNLYKEQYGREAEVEFWRTFGDEFFDFTTSLSKNTSGVGATVSDVANLQKYDDLVSDLSEIDPKVIGVISAADRGDYKFSPAAYQWQLENNLSPGSAEKFRSSKSPAEAARETQISLGWVKYREVMDRMDEVMIKRGLTNLRQNGAEDLAALKKQLIASIVAGEGTTGKNLDWYIDYKDTDGSKYIKTKLAFETILNNDKFMADHGNDPTWKSVSVYLDVRDKVDNVLKTRESNSLGAKSNEDLAGLLEMAAFQLKQQDIGFSDIYDRYFAYDPGYDPILSGDK